MRSTVFIITLILAMSSSALSRTECRKHYINIITSDTEENTLSGSEQIDLFFQPEKIKKKFKSAKNDSILDECIKNNNK